MKRPVIVRSYSSRAVAETARSVLEGSGVEVFLASDDAGAQYPGLGFTRGAHLLVSSEQLGRAKKVLASAKRPSRRKAPHAKRHR